MSLAVSIMVREREVNCWSLYAILIILSRAQTTFFEGYQGRSPPSPKESSLWKLPESWRPSCRCHPHDGPVIHSQHFGLGASELIIPTCDGAGRHAAKLDKRGEAEAHGGDFYHCPLRAIGDFATRLAHIHMLAPSFLDQLPSLGQDLCHRGQFGQFGQRGPFSHVSPFISCRTLGRREQEPKRGTRVAVVSSRHLVSDNGDYHQGSPQDVVSEDQME